MEKCPYCGSRNTLEYHRWKYYLAITGDVALAIAKGLLHIKANTPGSFMNVLSEEDKEYLYYCMSCHKVF